MQAVLERYYKGRYSLYRWRYEARIAYKLLLCLGMATITGIAAQVRISLPWTPVPITGQTFAVLLSGVVLGKWGAVAQAIYAGLGFAGLPWFAGLRGGLPVLFGPTAGYIFGFIIAAWFVGYLTDKFINSRGFISMLAILLFANFILIHIPGLIWLGSWLKAMGRYTGVSQLLWMGSVPFILGDITKAVAVAFIAKAITPKTSYNGEIDKGSRLYLP